MASAAAEVARRCEAAKENGHLVLNGCELTQVPDAVYLFMASTTVTVCNLSDNALKRVPPKLPATLSSIKVLDVSHNGLTGLPGELGKLTQLQTLNISHNALDTLPPVIYSLHSLQTLVISHNRISLSDNDLARLQQMAALKDLDLRENPLSEDTKQTLLALPCITVRLGSDGP